MNVVIENILLWGGVVLLLVAVIRFVSFYFLYFRSRRLEQSRAYRMHIGAQRFSSKLFYKIDFPVPDRLERLKKVSDGSLYISISCIIGIIFLIIGQTIIKE